MSCYLTPFVRPDPRPVLAPKQAKELSWEDGVSANDTIVRFMGHGIMAAGMCQSAMHSLSDGDKKQVVKGLALLHSTVAVLIGHATHNKELKQNVGVANVVLHSAMAVACAARGFRKDDDET